MKRDVEFHDYVMLDLFVDIRGLTSRGMFGGYGIYCDGDFFALIAGNELYFKVDEKTLDEYKKFDSHPFQYSTKDRGLVTLGYWSVPEEVMEDREKLIDWVEKACAVAKRKKKQKK